MGLTQSIKVYQADQEPNPSPKKKKNGLLFFPPAIFAQVSGLPSTGSIEASPPKEVASTLTRRVPLCILQLLELCSPDFQLFRGPRLTFSTVLSP